MKSLIELSVKLISSFWSSKISISVDFYILNQNNKDFDKAEYEEIITKDLLNYINDDKLLLLPIPVLHRVMTKYCQKNSEQTSIEKDQSEIT